ncbi:MAG: hemolysin family protein [Phycisphaerales bacterium]
MARTDVVLLVLLPLLLVLSAFASASETALFGVTPGEQAGLRRRSPVAARIVSRLRSKPRRLLGQVLMVNMLANVSYFVATSVLTVRAEGAFQKVLISVVSVSAIVLIGEVFAKLFATRARVGFLRVTSPVHLVISTALEPVLDRFDRFVIAPLSRLIAPSQREPVPVTPEELGALIELSTEDGSFQGSEQELLRSIISLGARRVREVMRPRVDLIPVEQGAERDVMLMECIESGHARYPVCDGGLDGNVVGMLDATRLLSGWTVPRSMMPVLFVPELARLDALLERLRDEGMGVAMCVDEHGGIAGMITLSDVVDELVSGAEPGELGDEEGADRPGVERIGERTWSVPGRLRLRELSDAFGARDAQQFAGRATTIAGLLMTLLGRVPEPGDRAELGDLELRVGSVRERSVLRVEVTLMERGA